MKITHKIDDFLLELFPQYKKSNLDLSILKEEITKYFTVEPYKPRVSIEGEWISIEVDTVENPLKLTPSRHGKLTPFGHFKLTP